MALPGEESASLRLFCAALRALLQTDSAPALAPSGRGEKTSFVAALRGGSETHVASSSSPLAASALAQAEAAF